jgi:general secretion pathway protein G
MRSNQGFTLIELIIVIAVIGILASIAIPQMKPAPTKAREAVLKTDLHLMREAIDQYFADKAHYPESLETLVEDGYLRSVPKDPFTDSTSTWKLIYASTSQEESTPEEIEAGGNGIFDVKSGTTKQALNGEQMSDW